MGKLSEQEKAILKCMKDLETYYDKCGNSTDWENLGRVRFQLNYRDINNKQLEEDKLTDLDETRSLNKGDNPIFYSVSLTDKDKDLLKWK